MVFRRKRRTKQQSSSESSDEESSPKPTRKSRHRPSSSSSEEKAPRRHARKAKENSSESSSSDAASPEAFERKCDHVMTPLPVSHEEKMLYKETFSGIGDIPKDKLYCTACRKDLNKAVASQRSDCMHPHPVLGVLLCKNCYSFYGEGFLEDDGDGNDAYCRWCAQGGQLYCCSSCNCAFCKKCIHRNFERSVAKEVQESEDWMCFACEPKNLLCLRAVCSTVFESFRVEKKKFVDERLKILCKKKEEPVPRSTRSARVTNGKPKSRSSSEDDNSGSGTSEEEAVPAWLKECMLDAIHITKVLYKAARKIRKRHNPSKGQDGISRTVRNLSKVAALLKDNGKTLEEKLELGFIGEEAKTVCENKEEGNDECVEIDNKNTDTNKDIPGGNNDDRKELVVTDVCNEVNNIANSCVSEVGISIHTDGRTEQIDKASSDDIGSATTVIISRIGDTDVFPDENNVNTEVDCKDETHNKEKDDANENIEESSEAINVEPDLFDMYGDDMVATPCAPSPVPSIVTDEEDTFNNGSLEPGITAEQNDVCSNKDDDAVSRGNKDVEGESCGRKDKDSELDTSMVSLDAPTDIIIDSESFDDKVADVETEIFGSSECDLIEEIETAKLNVLASSSSDENEEERNSRLRKRKSINYSINEEESGDESKTFRRKKKLQKDKKEKNTFLSDNEEEETSVEEIIMQNGIEKAPEDVNEEKDDSKETQSVKGDVKKKKRKVKESSSKKEPCNSQDSDITHLNSVSDSSEEIPATDREKQRKVAVKTDKDKTVEKGKTISESSDSSLSDDSDIDFCETRKRKKRSSLDGAKTVSRKLKDADEKHEEEKEDTNIKAQESKNIEDDIKRLSNLRNFRVKKTDKPEKEKLSADEVDEHSENEEQKENGEDLDKKGTETEVKEKKSNGKDSELKKQKESLLEYLNILSSDDEGNASSELKENDVDAVKKKAIAVRQSIATRNELAKKLVFKSSSGSDNSDDSLQKKVDEEMAQKKKERKKDNGKPQEKQTVKKEEPSALITSEDDEDEADKATKDAKSKWKRSKLLTVKLSETDSEEEVKQFLKRKLKEEEKKRQEVNEKNSDSDFEDMDNKTSSIKKPRKRVIDSDSDLSRLSSSSDEPSSSDDDKKKKKKTKKRGRRSDSSVLSLSDSSDTTRKKKKRRRIKELSDGSKSSDENDDDKGADSQKTDTPGKGRKNIRKLFSEEELGKRTKAAAKEEEERKKRISERQKLYNQVFEITTAGVEKLDRLVLDFDPETKKELVAVHPKIVEKLKPHQVKGIKFMWDACFESLEQIKEGHTSGCILAHCMGLGKTLQVVALVHTLLSHEATGINSILVVCPLNTVLNWKREFHYWLKDIENTEDIDVYELTTEKQNYVRAYKLNHWQKTGGIMILGYDMYRNLTSTVKKRMAKKHTASINSSLVDPGPDMIVCDEGHLLKNAQSALSKALSQITTLRRIVLTGTPLQNNLKEYHCMISFVKPNLLGTEREFRNRFLNPIMNGQHADSTQLDVRIMKRRAHVLHKMLDGCVQRFDYNVLTPFLPPKHEYVVCIRLSPIQVKLYQHYLEHFARNHPTTGGKGVGAGLFADFHSLQRVWTHPYVLKLSAAQEEYKRMMADDSESEGSLKDFIDDDDASDSSDSNLKVPSSSSDSEDDVVCLEGEDDTNPEDKKKKKEKHKEVINKWKSSTRSAKASGAVSEKEEEVEAPKPQQWWSEYVSEEDFENINHSGKLFLLFTILKECELIGDKLLVFSHSLFSLNAIEHFLNKVDESTQNITQSSEASTNVAGFLGSWARGLDYFRIDGSSSSENRNSWCHQFNDEENHRARLFLISTKAGGLGINLVGANRVVIFDASWNPSHDVQSIFRVFRFGQKKPCYIYRFLAEATMEEKIYDRQVTKLSLACRVVDEQQIERHFNAADLSALYEFDPTPKEKGPTPVLPKDRLLADLLHECGDWIFRYFEHDSLLENVEEEELTEDERKQAWEEFENEKKGLVKTQFLPSGAMPNFQPQQGPAINMPSLLAMIRRENPTLSEQALVQRYQEAVLQVRSYIERQQAVAAATNTGYQVPMMFSDYQPQRKYLDQAAMNLRVQQQYGNLVGMPQAQVIGRYPVNIQPRVRGTGKVKYSAPVVRHTLQPGVKQVQMIPGRTYSAVTQAVAKRSEQDPLEIGSSSKDSDEVVIIP